MLRGVPRRGSAFSQPPGSDIPLPAAEPSSSSQPGPATPATETASAQPPKKQEGSSTFVTCVGSAKLGSQP